MGKGYWNEKIYLVKNGTVSNAGTKTQGSKFKNDVRIDLKFLDYDESNAGTETRRSKFKNDVRIFLKFLDYDKNVCSLASLAHNYNIESDKFEFF